MNAISIVIRIIAIAGAAAAVYFYFDLGDELDETRQQLSTTQQNLTRTETRLSDVQSERDELNERTAEFESRLEEAENRVSLEAARAEELEEELAQVTESLEEAEAARDEFQAEAANWREQLIAEREQRPDLPEGEEDIVASLQRDLRQTEAALEDARARLAEFGPAENGDAEASERTLETVRGNVTAVDSVGGFVVLDIGAESNLRTGDDLMVHRAGTFIARVRISRVAENESIAQILPGTVQRTIGRGDAVRITKARIN